MNVSTFDATTPETLPSPGGATCAACGSPLDANDHFCQACGVAQPEPAKSDAATDVVLTKHFRCSNCGAEMTADARQRSYTCPFCTSNYVVEFSPELTGRQLPEFVIGFAVTHEEATRKFRQWLRCNGWFQPADLHTARIHEDLKGIYLPFWSFSMLARTEWSANIGEYWYRTETYTTFERGKLVRRTRRVQETEWWDLAGRHHSYYSGYLLSASRGLTQADAERIKPFRLAALKRYAPSFLAGWLAEDYSIERENAMAMCIEEFRRQDFQNVSAFMPGDTHSELRTQVEFDRINSDLILLPIYLLSYKYQDKVYRFLVNGQTGRVAGDKPTSQKRVATAIAGGVIAAIILLLLIWMLAG